MKFKIDDGRMVLNDDLQPEEELEFFRECHALLESMADIVNQITVFTDCSASIRLAAREMQRLIDYME